MKRAVGCLLLCGCVSKGGGDSAVPSGVPDGASTGSPTTGSPTTGSPTTGTPGGTTGSSGTQTLPSDLETPAVGEWPMFKRDLRHTGLVTDLSGAMAGGACIKWHRKVSGPRTRGAGGAVIARVDGAMTVMVATDGWCSDDEVTCQSNDIGQPGKVYAFRGDNGETRWSQLLDDPLGQADPYAPLVADVDADGYRELVVPSTNARWMYVFAADPGPGQVAGQVERVLELPDGHKSESAPSAANLDDDAALEILLGTDADGSADLSVTARFLAFDGATGAVDGDVPIPNRATEDTEGCGDGGRKIDSSQPAIALRDGWVTAFVGAWNGYLYAFDGRSGAFDVAWTAELPRNTDGNPCVVPKVRSSPAIADLDQDGALELVFGWMYQEGLVGDPTPDREASATLQVVDLDGNLLRSAERGVWKSSPTVADLDPSQPGLELAMGRVGGVMSVYADDLALDWEEGPAGQPATGVRSSPAVADLDGDGELEVAFGIEGVPGTIDVGLYVYDAATGALEWSVPMGWDGGFYAGASASPAVGDIDEDGELEVVLHTADGWLYAVDSCP